MGLDGRGGANSSVDQPGVYGTLGTPGPGNIPGARAGASSWTDTNGNLWLFGGVGPQASGSVNYFNDLWEYSPAKSEWAWMSGTSLTACGGQFVQPCYQGGVYGTLASPAAANVPGSRSSAVSWTDKSGNLWLFGGLGWDSVSDSSLGYISPREGDLNDIWEFNLSLDQWVWMGGDPTIPPPANGPGAGSYSGQPGVYGTLGAVATGNIPTGRDSASSWIDTSGNLWLLGGTLTWYSGFTGSTNEETGGYLLYLNDLWYAKPGTTAPTAPPAPTTTPEPTITVTPTSNPESSL